MLYTYNIQAQKDFHRQKCLHEKGKIANEF